MKRSVRLIYCGLDMKKLLLLFACACFLGSYQTQAADINCPGGKPSTDVAIKLMSKQVVTSQGITEEMGIFSIRNNGVDTLHIRGYKEKSGFVVWHPTAWLEAKSPEGNWRQTLYLAGSFELPPQVLTVGPGGTETFISRAHPNKTGVLPSDEVRLVIRSENPQLCAASASFPQN
jgi:hypothetical protein